MQFFRLLRNKFGCRCLLFSAATPFPNSFAKDEQYSIFDQKKDKNGNMFRFFVFMGVNVQLHKIKKSSVNYVKNKGNKSTGQK